MSDCAQQQRPAEDDQGQQHQQQQQAAGAGAVPPPDGEPGENGTPPPPNGVMRFLGALFEPKEPFTVRYIETWTEGGKKKSRVVYGLANGLDRRESITEGRRWAALNRLAAKSHANMFFGVCPRPKKGCERSIHIRIVRCLWTDIDHCTPDEALQRCEKAGLPRPSIVVSSGNGVHVYWLLAEPFHIDDAGELRPIGQYWTTVRRHDGAPVIKDNGEPKTRPRDYVRGNRADGEPDYVWEFLTDEKTDNDSNKPNPLFPRKLSPKALHVQDVLQGIAKQIGGDHTTDLARLLRLPDTMNRKDERNGKAPVPCVLVECDPARRYSFGDFEKFAALSPDKEKREKVAAIRLPHKNLTPARLDKLGGRINRCAVAEPGARSEVDFALCCYAIRKGFSADDIWHQVQNVGKFAEAGRRYFDLTWNRAEDSVREDIYDKACRSVSGKAGARHKPSANGTGNEAGDGSAPNHEGEGTGSPPPGDTTNSDPGERVRDLPNIIVNDRQLRDVTQDALDAIRDANDPPRLFQRGGELCRLKVDPDTQAPALELLHNAKLCNHLARVANWISERDDGEEVTIENVSPPGDVVSDVGSMPSYPELPVINAVVECPTFSRDGELVIAPGYHPGARLLYFPRPGFDVPAVPERPSQGDVAEARRLIVEEVYGDFPFADQASRAHAVVATIQPFVRQMIDGGTPLVLFDAPSPGTGKTLIVSCGTNICTGRDPEPMAEADNDEEYRKAIHAALCEGPAYVFLDNLNRTLDSSSLAMALTSTRVKGRVLGLSRMVVAPNTATWIASGNNTRLSKEMTRRTLLCRIDAKREDPWDRPATEFRHPKLLAWIRQSRPRLVWAALVICQAWIAAGQPKGTQTLGMFESWAEVMGGILDVAGIPGLLGNADIFRKTATDKADEWKSFLKAWWNKHKVASVGVRQLYELAKELCLLDGLLGDKGERSQRTKLGNTLKRARDSVSGGYRVEYRGDDHADCALYGLVPTPDGAQGKQANIDGEGEDATWEG
jgi:hypothetical protein